METIEDDAGRFGPDERDRLAQEFDVQVVRPSDTPVVADAQSDTVENVKRVYPDYESGDDYPLPWSD